MTGSPKRDPDLDPQLLGLLQMLDSMQAKPMYEGTAQEARASSRVLSVDMRDPATVPEVASVEDVQVAGGAGEIPARIYRPSLEGTRPTIAYFHGGGFVTGDLDTIDSTCRTTARECDAVVVSIDYRLAPEHPAPAAAQDAVAATRWVADHLDELGASSVLGVAGDSAGGNLAAGVAQAFRDGGIPLAGQLLFYPAADLAGQADYPSMVENATGYLIDRPTIEWFMEQYLGDLHGTGAQDPRLSPLRGDVTGVAPAIITTAGLDPLRDQGTAYADELRTAGVPVQTLHHPSLIHSYIDLVLVSQAAKDATDQALRAYRDLLHR